MGVRMGPIRHLSARLSRRISHGEIGSPLRTLIQGLGLHKEREKQEWRTGMSVQGTGRRLQDGLCSVAMAQENKTVRGPALIAKYVILYSSSICPGGKAI